MFLLRLYMWRLSRRVRAHIEDTHVRWIQSMHNTPVSAELEPTWDEIVRQELRND